MSKHKLDTAGVMDTDDLEFNRFAEGVFLAMTGQTVEPFKPQYAGWLAGCNGMSASHKASYYNYCVNKLGYVDPLPHWSDNPQHSASH